MNELFFFDLRPRQVHDKYSGNKVDIKILMENIHEEDMLTNHAKYLDITDLDTHISCTTKNKDWEKIVRTILILTSGKTILDKQLCVYKEVYRAIEKRYSDLNFDIEFATFFVSIIIGFRFHNFGWSEQGSNKVSDAIDFIDNIIANRLSSIFVSSVFCAHRESDSVDMNTLVKEIKEVSLKRYVYLLYSIFININSRCVQIDLYHTAGGVNALNEVFPNIALKYIRENRVGELLDQMNLHFEKAREIIENIKVPDISITLIRIDSFVLKVEEMCQKIGGKDWRQIKNFNFVNNVDLRIIAQEMTLNDIVRYMPEYVQSVDTGSFSATTPDEKKAVDWYLGKGRLNLHSKSLYETMFYYYWGVLTKEKKGIAVGIDRDHDLFQVESFSLGYNDSLDISISSPLLYARRTEEELNTSDINSTSIRQFWRISENVKK